MICGSKTYFGNYSGIHLGTSSGVLCPFPFEYESSVIDSKFDLPSYGGQSGASE